jgi:hypothetical protein
MRKRDRRGESARTPRGPWGPRIKRHCAGTDVETMPNIGADQPLGTREWLSGSTIYAGLAEAFVAMMGALKAMRAPGTG